MVLFWVTTGILMVAVGVYIIHHQDKNTGIVNRLGAIGLTMFGSYLLWFVAAVHIPPVHEVKVKVVTELKDGYVLSFATSNARSCSIEKLEVSLVKENGDKISVPSRFVYSTKTGTEDFGFIFVDNSSSYDADKVSVSVTHFCPFGFEVETILSTMRLHSVVTESPPKL